MIDPLQVVKVPDDTGLPRFLSCRSVARILDVSIEWVRLWHKEAILRGHVFHAAPGDRGVLLFRLSDVRAFIAARGLPTDAGGAEAESGR